jgi:dTDP-4-amino-4,6-dideoxygalactose transaminase
VKKIVLFHPFVPDSVPGKVSKVLCGRWLGEGPQVKRFEELFSMRMGGRPCVATGSCTDALHLAYILAGIKHGDEVISPVFTCTATTTALLYMGANVVFADIQKDTLNINVDHIKELINETTRAIVCVHYGGCPCDMDDILAIADEYGIPVIEDAAQALSGYYHGTPIGTHSPYVAFSFQAIKHITTGDGGMLVMADKDRLAMARRIRWFGIDREAKLGGVWENDIWELGYKYQMTDIAATMGIEGLLMLPAIMEKRRRLFKIYSHRLKDIALGLDNEERKSAAWLFTVAVDNREGLQKKLLEYGVESNPVHYRNDRYTVFRQFKTDCPNMDALENKYLVLPLHMKMTHEDANYICDIILEGW